MKKALSILLIVAMMLSAAAVLAVSASADDEPQNPVTDAVLGTPTIDGEVDDVWKKASVQEVKTVVSGASPSTVKFRTLYDAENLYFLFDVLDNTPTTQARDEAANPSSGTGAFITLDGIMLAITIPKLSQKTGATNAIGFQSVITSYGKVFLANYASPAGEEKLGLTAKSTLRKNAADEQIGFYLEVAVPVAHDWNADMSKGSEFLTCVLYNDNYGPTSTKRDAQLTWSETDSKAASWNGTATRGSIFFDEPLSVAVEGTPTVDGTMDTIWAAAAPKRVTNRSTAVAGTSYSDVRFRTLYDDKAVYYFFEVLDDTPTTKARDDAASGVGGFITLDSIMLCMSVPQSIQSGTPEKDHGFQAVISSYGRVVMSGNATTVAAENREGISAKSVIVKNAADEQIGFNLEVKVPLAKDYLATMQKGSNFATAVIYNDNYGPDSTKRDAQLSWSDTDAGSWGTAAKRGIVSIPADPEPITLDTTRPIALAAKGTPVIDGTIDTVWGTTKAYQYTAVCNAPAADSEYADFPVIQPSFRVLWDDNSLYLLFVVVDPTMGNAGWEQSALASNLWKRDSVMLSFDLNYSREVTGGPVVKSYDFNLMISAFGNTANNQDLPNSVFISTGEGDNAVPNYAISYVNYNADEYHCLGSGEYPGAYIIEMKMNLKDFYSDLEMKEGNYIGFYTLVNDNFATEAETGRNYQVSWFDEKFQGWNDTSEKGTIQFVNTVEQPDAVAEITLIDCDEIFNLKPGDNTNPGTNTGETTTTATETPTTAPEPGTSAPEPDTKAPEKTKKKGCGSTVAGSSIALVSLVTLGFAFVDKKKRK